MESIQDKLALLKKFTIYVGLVIAVCLAALLVFIMILAAGKGLDKGCIRDNGVTESSILSARGYKTGGEKYEPRVGGGQTGEWQGTGYRSNGDAFLIDVSGKTYVTPLYGVNINTVKRCRICAKPKNANADKFKLKSLSLIENDLINTDSNEIAANTIYQYQNDDPEKNNFEVIDNCLCTKILGVDGITIDDLNDNPDLNHIYIRETPTKINNRSYCTEYMDSFGVAECSDGYKRDNEEKSPDNFSNMKSISNYSCTDKFYYDANGDNLYNGTSEDIVYNNPYLKYINLDYWKRDGRTRKSNDFQEPCYYDAGLGADIGLFGVDGDGEPEVTYSLYSEFYLKDSDSYRYRSPNSKIFPNHGSGEAIKLQYKDGYYDDNYGYYRINFIDGVMTKNFGGILSNIVQEVENLYVGDGYLKESFKRIVGNSIFQFLVKFTLIFYLSFSAIGIITGAVEISRKEFSGRILKIALILFFTNPNSWGWYNDIAVGFFMGAITTLSDLTLNLDFATKDQLITITEDKFDSSSGHAQKFAFPDQMIKTFFMSENIFIKLWSLLFSPFNFAGIFIIAGIYALMFYFVYIMAIFALNYLTAITVIITLLAIGPIIFLFSINKLTIVVFNRWLVYMSSRIVEITMLFLLLYVFLSAINDKIGLYQSLNPDSLLYFESCPYSLYDLMSWSADVTHLSDVDEYISNPISEATRGFVKELFSGIRVYVANPINGIGGADGNFVGGKDFFEMMSIIMEAFILLYFMNMIMSQIGLMAAAIISYQQQNASVFSGARGIAGEGSKILDLVKENALSAIKFAGGNSSNARSFVSRSASNVMKFSLEHDAVARKLNNSMGRAHNYAAGDLSSLLPDFYDAKAERIVKSNINAFEGKMKNVRSNVIFEMGLEDKISKESIEKIKNNQIDKKTLDELKSVNVKYDQIHNKMKSKITPYEKELRSDVIGKMLDKSDIAIREVNKYLAKQNMIHELNLLKEGEEFLTAPKAHKILSDKLSSRYDDINFSESLREVLNKNLTDREVLENSNKVQAEIISSLQSNEGDFDINNDKNYNKLQEKLREDKKYQSLQYDIKEHLSYNQNINRSVRLFANTDKIIDSKLKEGVVPKFIKNKPRTAVSVAAGSMVTVVVTGLAVPLVPLFAFFGVVGVVRNRKLIAGATYRLIRNSHRKFPSAKYLTAMPVKINGLKNKSTQFLSLINKISNPKYELYHIANSKENKALRFARKELKKQKLFLREVSEADKIRLEKITNKKIKEIDIEDIKINQEKIRNEASLVKLISRSYPFSKSKKLYQTKDKNNKNYVSPLASEYFPKIPVNDDIAEKINRLKINLRNIDSSKKYLTEAQDKIIEKIKSEKPDAENNEDEIRREISENYPNVKLLQKEYDKAKFRLEDTLYKYSMNREEAIKLLEDHKKEMKGKGIIGDQELEEYIEQLKNADIE